MAPTAPLSFLGEQVEHQKFAAEALMVPLATVVLHKRTKQMPQMCFAKDHNLSKHSSQTVRTKRSAYGLQFGLCAGMACMVRVLISTTKNTICLTVPNTPSVSTLKTADLFDDPELQRASEQVDALVVPVLEGAVRDGILRSDLPFAFLGELLESMLYTTWLAVEKGLLPAAEALRASSTFSSTCWQGAPFTLAASLSRERLPQPRERESRGRVGRNVA